jgi:hypothetical protein
MESEKNEFRKLFLKEFTRHLIQNVEPEKFKPLKETFQDLFPEEDFEVTPINLPMRKPLMPMPQRMQFKPRIQKPKIKEQMFQSQKIKPQNLSPMPIPSNSTSGPMMLGPNLEKVLSFLKDPSVQAVECTGPEKNLLVNKSGRIQTTSLNLTKDQINSIMQTISEQTRIPLISGVFKAVFGQFLITAVISEYVGTRFIIQKRPRLPMPIQAYG